MFILELKKEMKEEYLDKFTYRNSGDLLEVENWDLISGFPNHEIFWRKLIVPMTMRIETDFENSIMFRSYVENRLLRLAMTHYSILFNLLHAHHKLISIKKSENDDDFTNFCTNLSSACDLVEDLIVSMCVIKNEINEKTYSDMIAKIKSCSEFIISEEKQMEGYERLLLESENYFWDKGHFSFKLPLEISRMNLVEYFFEDIGCGKELKKYSKICSAIRCYRNTLVHNVKTFGLYTDGGTRKKIYKPSEVGKLRGRNWLEMMQRIDKYYTDGSFDYMSTIAEEMIGQLERVLNDIWGCLIRDFRKYLFEDQNSRLLKMYNLDSNLDYISSCVSLASDDPGIMASADSFGPNIITPSGTGIWDEGKYTKMSDIPYKLDDKTCD